MKLVNETSAFIDRHLRERENNPLKLFSAFQKLMISNGNINKKYVIIKGIIIKKNEENNFFINF
jgi:hypothetical protein